MKMTGCVSLPVRIPARLSPSICARQRNAKINVFLPAGIHVDVVTIAVIDRRIAGRINPL
ncbi:hypothetical protein [Erwinia tasmaniensis]|uniref:hypothetical protein n=1 Tax=Erwinia tasmaniensis TaxID=338565 RepID=UPI0012FF5687|nr:hypothetical protein [Erwinia tasmaniensis]